MALRFAGKTYEAIAKELKINAGTCKNWFTGSGSLVEEYRAYVEKVMTPPVPVERTLTGSVSIAEALKAAAPNALKNIIALGDGASNEAVKLSANKDVLDRAGYMPVQKMIQVHAVEEMSITELDAFVHGVLGAHDARDTRAASASAISPPAPSTAPVYKEGESIDVPDLTALDTDAADDAPDA